MEYRAFFDKVLEISPIGLVTLNTQGNITYANKEAEIILGLSRDVISQLSYNSPQWKITDFDGNSLPDSSLPFNVVLKTGKSIFNIEHAIEWPNGVRVYLSINGAPMFDKHNKLEAVVISFQDISSKVSIERKLSETQLKYKSLFDNLLDEVHVWKYVKDENGKIESWTLEDANPVALASWGKKKEEVIGRDTKEIFGEEAIKIFKPIVQKVFESNIPHRWEEYFPPTDQYLSMDSIPLGNYFISTGKDITKQIKVNLELQKAKEQAEQLARKSFENGIRLKQTQSMAKLGGWEFDLVTGRFTFNDNFYQIFRSSVDKIGGYEMSVMEYAERFIHPEDRGVVVTEIEKATNTSDPNFSGYIEHKMLYEDGDVGHLAVKYFVIKDDDLKTTKLFGFNQDISDRKRIEEELITAKELAEESESKLLEAQALSHVGSWEYTAETDTVTWSKELFNIFERSPELGAPPYSAQASFYTPESFILLEKAVQDCVLHQMPYNIELDIVSGSGRIKKIISKGQVKRGKDGRVIGCYGTAQDITEQKKIEHELILAKEKAEEGERIKTAFLQNLSHEIRTPLNAICGFAQILEKPNLTEESKRKYADLIQSNSQQLLAIVSDVLTASHLEKGSTVLNLKEVDINAFLEELYFSFKGKAEAKGLDLQVKLGLVTVPLIIETDEIKLRQVFTNLLINALKFTKQGYIEFGYSINEKQIEYYVKDTGIGIHPEKHQLIFERFRQADPSITREYGGNGLGLSITKSFVELLGGEIYVQSELNKGSIFHFNFPYQKKAGFDTNKPVQNFIILIAEDEIINYMVIEGLLMSLPVKLLHARNGQEAIELYQQHKDIDLVLMDIKMPGLTGDQAAGVIKLLNPSLPIIAQSGYALDNEQHKFQNIFDDYITKPINEYVLLKKVSQYLNYKMFRE